GPRRRARYGPAYDPPGGRIKLRRRGQQDLHSESCHRLPGRNGDDRGRQRARHLDGSTHIAGVNGQVMTRIAPPTTLIVVKVLSDCGSGSFAGVLTGMMYANSVGANVESMSLGGCVCADGPVAGSAYCAPGSAAAANGPALWQSFVNVVKFLH